MEAVDLFSEWALSGRDVGMAENHLPAVRKMLSLVLKNPIKNFSFLDIGCVNGYVVQEVSKHALCFKSIGIDTEGDSTETVLGASVLTADILRISTDGS